MSHRGLGGFSSECGAGVEVIVRREEKIIKGAGEGAFITRNSFKLLLYFMVLRMALSSGCSASTLYNL